MMQKIDEIFKTWVDHPGAGGQLLVTYKGKVIVDKCYGYANIENKVPITQDSVFHVASISKQFTAMAIAMLHEQGKLDIDDDVRKYIPDCIGFDTPVTIRQLVNHLTGFRCHYGLLYLAGRSSNDCVMQEDLLRLISRQKKLNFTPGEQFMYSNPNYVLMATIVERISGMTFPQWAKKYLFEPLGMKDTFVKDSPATLIHNRARGYLDNGYEYTNALMTINMYGSTGVCSTCRDLTKYMQQYQNPTLISRKTLDEIMLTVPQVQKGTTIYAGGLRIQDFEGHRTIHHGGVNAGYRSFGILFPDDDLIVTAFANTDNIPIETAGRDVARVVLGIPPRKPYSVEEFRTETVDWDAIPGFYYCDKNGDHFRITVKDGVVYHGSIPLEHLGGNVFKQGRLNLWFCFGEDTVCREQGSVMHLRKFEDKLDPALAEECVGTYYSEEVQGIWTVEYADGKLWWCNLRHGKQQMHWLEGDKFFVGMRTITFRRDENGKVCGYDHTNALIWNFPFQKIK